MRTSQFHLVTRKETPQDAEIISHQLMIRAGLIRKLGAGLYTWSPLGFRVLRKVEQIIREEMNACGALEMLMPAVQPKELWQETGRIEDFGGQLLAMTDRAEREYFFGPTHEEVITEFVRDEVTSYKQLPINFYQIQTKFRDEIRPRFGVMRSREFIMKDAYSFHLTAQSLEETYRLMEQTYSKILTRMGLQFRCVLADSGAIGGSGSQEFHVIADSGEDAIMYSDSGDYAANIEKCEAVSLIDERAEAQQALKEVATPLQFLDEKEVQQLVGCDVGSIGVKDLECPVIVDLTVAHMSDFVCGANKDDVHLTGVNWQRDAEFQQSVDIREAQVGDPSPDGKGTLKQARGIEVGHIFQLGDKYSKAMNAVVLDDSGRSQALQMGCYGMGVSRLVAAAIEQSHDDNGIIWPAALAPFQVAILPMNYQKSVQVKRTADELYAQLMKAGYEVILDDRKVRPGFMLSDFELLGIPHQVIIGDRSLDEGHVEYRHREKMEKQKIEHAKIFDFLQQEISL